MINIFQPDVHTKSIDLLSNVFESKWLGRGNYVYEFEKKFSEILKTSSHQIHTISCCTDAIFGVFHIFPFNSGDEVIIPSISFPAIGSAILASNLIPKIVDIDVNTGNINLSCLENALSSKTKAVFITHYGGIPVNIAEIRKIVGSEIKIFEDAACALGTYTDGIACGTEGDFGCWSFDAMKLLTCGEGGGIFINDSRYMEITKEYFYLGLPTQTKSGIDRQANDSRWWEYQLNRPGRRSIFTNINAAIGIPQFETIENSLVKRQKIRDYYCDILDKIGVTYLRQDDKRTSYSNYFFTILTDQRDQLASYLKENGIYSTFRYYPLHLIDLFKNFSQECKSASEFANQALNIPIHQSLSESDIEYIGKTLTSFFQR